jgi:hypothetical protein
LAGVSRITGWRYGEVYREQGVEGAISSEHERNCENWASI